MNLKYTKNIEGKFGFYMNGGLVKPEYVTDTFNSFVYRVNYLDEQITNLKKQIELMEAVVTFYADEGIWIGCKNYVGEAVVPMVSYDNGNCARSVKKKLKELREGSEK